MRRLLLVGLTGLLAACSTASPAATTAATTTTTPTTVAPTTTTEAPGADCGVGETLLAGDGVVIGGERPADAGQVSGVTRLLSDGCERIEIELASSGGAPATATGPVDITFAPGGGVIHVRLDPAITSTALSDLVIDEDIVKAAYVVRELTGGLRVDLLLSAPAEARVSTSSSPARITIGLSQGSGEVMSPITGDRIVLLSPLEEHVTYPITVSGYSRTFEATVIARLRRASEILVEDFTTSADWLETWGEFTIEIPTGPAGRLDLFVGEDSARDGSEEGVTVSLTVR